MSDIRCIAISTGGGDAPGLNAVIRAAVKAAILKYQWKVIGIPDGFDGLIWPEKSFELTLKHVSGIFPVAAQFSAPPTVAIPFSTKRLRAAGKWYETFLQTFSLMQRSWELMRSLPSAAMARRRLLWSFFKRA